MMWKPPVKGRWYKDTALSHHEGKKVTLSVKQVTAISMTDYEKFIFDLN